MMEDCGIHSFGGRLGFILRRALAFAKSFSEAMRRMKRFGGARSEKDCFPTFHYSNLPNNFLKSKYL